MFVDSMPALISVATGKVGDRKCVENDKSDKNGAYFDFLLLYNSDFVNFVKNDNKLNLSSVVFVTFNKHDNVMITMMMTNL